MGLSKNVKKDLKTISDNENEVIVQEESNQEEKVNSSIEVNSLPNEVDNNNQNDVVKEALPLNFESKFQDLTNFLENNSSSKIKSIRNDLDLLTQDLLNIYKSKVSQFEEINKEYAKSNELIQDKIKKLEERASKEIADKIAEMDARKVEEIETAKKFAMEKAADGALKVVDTIEFAIKFASKDPAVKNYVSGFQMALDQFIKWLGSLNINKINIKPGDVFDEYKMSALEQVKSNLPKNAIVEVKISGYEMHDKVIRHASVSVSDGSLAPAGTPPLVAQNKSQITNQVGNLGKQQVNSTIANSNTQQQFQQHTTQQNILNKNQNFQQNQINVNQGVQPNKNQTLLQQQAKVVNQKTQSININNNPQGIKK